jgi:peptidoglycan/LPS O-acetylase OafA/YrhL
VAFNRGWRLPHRARHVGAGGLAVLLVCAATVPRESAWLYVGGGFTLVGLAATALVASVLDARSRLARAFSGRRVVGLGRGSYSLYLWHVPVFLGVANRLSARPAGTRLLVGLVGCAVATVASYRLVERPAARLRQRLRSDGATRRQPALEPRRSRPLTTAVERQPIPSALAEPAVAYLPSVRTVAGSWPR